eukprot:Ihof_evm10s28 gene=Ihof_evmTU10s28
MDSLGIPEPSHQSDKKPQSPRMSNLHRSGSIFSLNKNSLISPSNNSPGGSSSSNRSNRLHQINCPNLNNNTNANEQCICGVTPKIPRLSLTEMHPSSEGVAHYETESFVNVQMDTFSNHSHTNASSTLNTPGLSRPCSVESAIRAQSLSILMGSRSFGGSSLSSSATSASCSGSNHSTHSNAVKSRTGVSRSSISSASAISRKVSKSVLLPSIITTRFGAFSGPEHHRPDSNTKYFSPAKQQDRRVCAVVYPFFNEGRRELERSVQGIHKQAIDLQPLGIDVYVVAIMDGWWRATADMKQYVKEMFPCDDWVDEPWWDYINTIPEAEDVVETYVLQRVNAMGHIEGVNIGNNMWLNMTMIIKRDNRRKHNSHEWFFMGFCPAYNSEYAFATDCGTLYADKCLLHLIEYMENHPEVAASTGRQRVMSAAMQETEDEGFIAMWYRASQAYDYEASISSFQGAFSLVGMLPVLPGPCGLYRMSDIQGECLDYYFNTVNMNPDDTGMITGNLLLAEDRILSYAAALKTGKFTMWVPHAVFYFEAETDSSAFIAQRRRWTNGSFAGYIFLVLTHPGLLLHSNHTWYFKIGSTFLLFLQLLMFFLVSISPAIFMSMGFYSVRSIGVFPENIIPFVQFGELVFYCLLYLGFIFVHNQIKFVPILYYTALFFNAILLMMILTGIIVSAIFRDFIVIVIVLLIMGTPFLLSLIHSVESFILMLTTFVPFMLFLPTFVAWFSAYSFSRTWDLTWGNRPSDQLEGVTVNKREKTMGALKRKGILINFSIGALNIIIGVALSHGLGRNVFVILSLAIGMPSIITMFLSFFYFLLYTPHQGSKTVWHTYGRSTARVTGLFSSVTAFALLVASLASHNWVNRSGLLAFQPDGAAYWARYGLMKVCYQVPALYSVTGEFVSRAGTFCQAYGTNPVLDWPSPVWVLLLIMMVLATSFSAVSLVATILTGFMTDKSRADETAAAYMSISTILLFGTIFVFPATWGDHVRLLPKDAATGLNNFIM